MGTVAIVDYGVGNLKSVANALSYLGCSSCITADPAELERADAIILPGVGAFPDAADRLRSGGLDQHVLAQGQKKPVLGICLGMQLLLEQGREVRPCPGLGVIRGTVDRIPTQSKLPHIGWNSLRFFHLLAPVPGGGRGGVCLLRPLLQRPRHRSRPGDRCHRLRAGSDSGGVQRELLRDPVPPGEERRGGADHPAQFRRAELLRTGRI